MRLSKTSVVCAAPCRAVLQWVFSVTHDAVCLVYTKLVLCIDCILELSVRLRLTADDCGVEAVMQPMLTAKLYCKAVLEPMWACTQCYPPLPPAGRAPAASCEPRLRYPYSLLQCCIRGAGSCRGLVWAGVQRLSMRGAVVMKFTQRMLDCLLCQESLIISHWLCADGTIVRMAFNARLPCTCCALHGM